MYKMKDFYLKRIYNSQGKKLGVVKDIFLDFEKAKVLGLEISNYSIINKKNYLDIQDIVSFNEDIVCTELNEFKGLRFSEIKELEIYDKDGQIKGEVEDLIISEDDYRIKGIVCNTGVIDKIIYGKEIVLINKCVLGDNFIYYLGDDEIIVKSLVHHIDINVHTKKA